MSYTFVFKSSVWCDDKLTKRNWPLCPVEVMNIVMLRRRGTYTVNTDTDSRLTRAKPADLVPAVVTKHGTQF